MGRPEEEKIKELADKWLKGTLTAAESEQLEEWYKTAGNLTSEWSRDESEEALYQRLWNDFQERKQATIPVRKLWRRNVAAAVVGFLFLLGTYFYSTHLFRSPPKTESYAVRPGGNKATLTLANGKKIRLKPDSNGIVYASGALSYRDGMVIADERQSEAADSITLETPKGGQYKILLPDGTEVWLNAQSKLRYPGRFSENQREVELEGEAFFNVANSSKSGKGLSSFVVRTKQQEVLVLGTAFNVSAYADEQRTRTFLVNGRVKVKAMYLGKSLGEELRPGQEATTMNGKVEVKQIDPEDAIAWKEGRFSFNNKRFSEVMKQLERWYNIEVQYEGGVPDVEFYGGIYRDSELSTVLKIMQSAEVSYRMEGGNKLIVINRERRNSMQR